MASLTKTSSLTVQSHRTPHTFFTPTHLTLSSTRNPDDQYTWQSRKARKGRYGVKGHRVHYAFSSSSSGAGAEPGSEEGLAGKEREMVYLRLKGVESEFKPGLKGDVSFWIAIMFTLGSAVWVVNGFLIFIPILVPALDSDTNSLTASATAFVGGTIFEIGSYLMVVEALDRGRELQFGTALGRLLHHRRRLPSSSNPVSRQPATNPGVEKTTQRDGMESRVEEGGVSPVSSRTQIGESSAGGKGKKFVWWGKPMWHDLGYLAALIQLFAATIFWISTLTGLPGVIPGFADGGGSLAIIDVFFWTPQVVGGIGFMLSSLILMIEVQTKWYKPNLTDIGWQVGLWNLIGAVGFMLCGAFGYSPSEGLIYQSGCSTFWGSPAFLIGSLFQLWEVIWREPAGDSSGPDTSTSSREGK